MRCITEAPETAADKSWLDEEQSQPHEVEEVVNSATAAALDLASFESALRFDTDDGDEIAVDKCETVLDQECCGTSGSDEAPMQVSAGDNRPLKAAGTTEPNDDDTLLMEGCNEDSRRFGEMVSKSLICEASSACAFERVDDAVDDEDGVKPTTGVFCGVL